MDTALIIKPFADADFATLPREQRDRVNLWLWAIEHCPASLPTMGKSTRFDWMASATGSSVATAKRLYYLYQKSRDWHVLMDQRSVVRQEIVQHGHRTERYRAWVQHKGERYQRKSAPAWREIKRVFLYGGEEIPGFEGWIPNGHTLPRGVSKAGFDRIMQQVRHDLATVRISLKANKAHLPSVYTTRADVPVGRIVQMDDMWHDDGIVHGGEVVRVLEFGMVDVASACRIHWGTIPRVVRDDGSKEGLCKKLFIAFVAYYCRYIGVHPDGTIMQMEHGTATLGKLHQSILEDSWGMVRVDKGSIHGHEQAKFGGYKGRSMGNPARKTMVEVMGNMIHNERAAFPLQFGKDRDHQPDATHGMVAYQQQLRRWEDKLLSIGREDLAMALQSPAMTHHQFGQILTDVYKRINGRTDHDLEGWQGHTVLEFQISPGHWVSQGEVKFIDEAQRDMFLAAARSNPGLIRERKMSPAEVWNAGKNTLIKMPLPLYVEFIGRDYGRDVTVRKRVITVQDKYVAKGEPLIYEAVVYQDGRKTMLDEGQTYRVVMNPYNVNCLVVLDADGRILGEAPLYVRVSRLDQDGIVRKVGHQSHLIEQATALQQARHAQDNADAEALRDHNSRIAQEGGLLDITPPRPRKSKPAPVSPEDFGCLSAIPGSTSNDDLSTDDVSLADLSDLY